MKAIGEYTWCWAGGPNQEFTTSPFFDIRSVGLLSCKKVVYQILIKGNVWINAPWQWRLF